MNVKKKSEEWISCIPVNKMLLQFEVGITNIYPLILSNNVKQIPLTSPQRITQYTELYNNKEIRKL